MTDDVEPLKSLQIRYVDPRDLVLLTRNAHFMSQPKFEQLVKNIRRDGALTSVPFAVRLPDGRYQVRSGNHRTRAAIEAGLAEIAVMCCDDPLEADRAMAIQLSHNALVGEDDPAIVKELYEEIDDIDWRAFAGLDDATLDLLEQVKPVSLAETSLDFRTISLMFLPHELPEVQAAFDEARDLVHGDETWLMSMGDFDALMETLSTVGGAYKIKNQALALTLLLRIALAHLDDLVDGWWDRNLDAPKHRGWVPLVSLFGIGEIPADAAGVVLKALERMKGTGDVKSTSLWQAIELWAADYLASDE